MTIFHPADVLKPRAYGATKAALPWGLEFAMFQDGSSI